MNLEGRFLMWIQRLSQSESWGRAVWMRKQSRRNRRTRVVDDGGIVMVVIDSGNRKKTVALLDQFK